MITMTELIENLEKEIESVEYEYDLKEVCKEYNEEDLYYYESGNRMSGLGGIIILYKNNKYRVLRIDEEDELLYKTFPIAMNMEFELFKRDYDEKYQNEKYTWYFTGFGGKLFIDRRVFEDFKKVLYSFLDNVELPVENDYPNEQVLHSYWITFAKKVFNNKKF